MTLDEDLRFFFPLFLSPPPQGFHFPLFMTLVHLSIIFSLSALSRWALQWWTGKPRVVLSWSDYIFKVAPAGGWVEG